MAERLRDLRWKQHPDHPAAASDERPDELPAIRLYPPDSTDYFVEFLNLPEVGQVEAKKWIPVQVQGGWFGLPTFRFQGLTEHGRLRSEQGVHYATPAMMALANLLSHPVIGRERMSGLIGNRKILRSAKDLGRVLALVHLSTRDEVEQWLEPWERALRACFPADWRELAGRASDGLRRLLEDAGVLEEAHYTCEIGLLNGRGVSPENLRLTGKQLLADLLDPLAEAARR